MIKNLFLSFFVLVLVGQIRSVAAANQLVIGWGDSLTEGLCTQGYNSPALQQTMAAAGRDTTQVNCGLGGETSAHSLSRMKSTLLCDGVAYDNGACTDRTQQYIWGSCAGGMWSREGWYTSLNGRRADFFLIWIGANDEIHKIGLSTTIYNIKEMVKLARSYKMTPILATLTPDAKYDMPRCDQGTLGGFNYTLQGLAQNEGVRLADLCAAIPYWTDDDCDDGLHPNSKGDQTIANVWMRAMPLYSDYPSTDFLTGPLLLLLNH